MASPGSAETSGATIAALLMLQRFSLELSRNAEAALGPSSTADLDLQLLLAVHRSGGAGPSELVELLGRPRSSVARALARLLDQGLTVRATSRPDARRALLRLTAAGEGRVDRFVAATSRTFTSNEPKVAALLLLFGRDPQAAASRGAATTVLAAAERLAAAEAAFTEELVPAMEVFGLRQASDRGPPCRQGASQNSTDLAGSAAWTFPSRGYQPGRPAGIAWDRCARAGRRRGRPGRHGQIDTAGSAGSQGLRRCVRQARGMVARRP